MDNGMIGCGHEALPTGLCTGQSCTGAIVINRKICIKPVIWSSTLRAVPIDSQSLKKEKIKFYIPKDFRKPMKWVRKFQCGRILEFRTQTRKSA
jgi:hypothetical protein